MKSGFTDEIPTDADAKQAVEERKLQVLMIARKNKFMYEKLLKQKKQAKRQVRKSVTGASTFFLFSILS